MHFIYHLSQKGIGYLHPGGKHSTDFVVNEILKQRPSKVLELGCGIGRTLVTLASKNVKSLVGVDISPTQISLAKRMVNQCELDAVIQLHVMDIAKGIEFENQSFDVVFAESILGILTHDTLVYTMQEVKRVLKPNGIFISNDAIWKAGTPVQIAEKMNNRVHRDFGLIQSTSVLIGKQQWEQFFYTMGFMYCRMVEINSLKQIGILSRNRIEMKADMLMLKCKRYSMFNLISLYETIKYKIKLHVFHSKSETYLENYIFILQI